MSGDYQRHECCERRTTIPVRYGGRTTIRRGEATGDGRSVGSVVRFDGRTTTYAGRRRWPVVAALVAVALLSAGCFKSDVVLTIGANGLVDGTVLMAYDRDALSSLNLTEATAQEQIQEDLTDEVLPGFRCEPWDDETYVGTSCELTGLSLGELSEADAFDQHLSFSRDGDVVRVTGTIDLSDLPPRPTGSMVNFSSRLRITFPGEVLEQTNGQVEGRTVTWLPEPASRTEIQAVARVGESPGFLGSVPLWVVVVAALAIWAAAVVALAGHGRKEPEQRR